MHPRERVFLSRDGPGFCGILCSIYGRLEMKRFDGEGRGGWMGAVGAWRCLVAIGFVFAR
jgi:hypothetical protein